MPYGDLVVTMRIAGWRWAKLVLAGVILLGRLRLISYSFALRVVAWAASCFLRPQMLSTEGKWENLGRLQISTSDLEGENEDESQEKGK